MFKQNNSVKFPLDFYKMIGCSCVLLVTRGVTYGFVFSYIILTFQKRTTPSTTICEVRSEVFSQQWFSSLNFLEWKNDIIYFSKQSYTKAKSHVIWYYIHIT